MVESAEDVVGSSADAVDKILNQYYVQDADDGTNISDSQRITEVDDISNIDKLDLAAIEQVDVADFETALGVAFDELGAISSVPPGLDDPAFINFALEQIMNAENASRDKYYEWGEMLKDMTENGLRDGLDFNNVDFTNPKEVFQHMQETLGKSLEFQQKNELLAMEISVSYEESAWIRTIATTLVKGTRRLITQT